MTSELIKHFPYLGLFVLLVLGGIGLPFPEDATLILCGFLIAHNLVRAIPAIIITYIGLLFADYFLYFVGRKYGRKIATHKRFHKILPPEKLAVIEDKFNKKGSLIILFGRHLLGLRAQLFITAGIMNMPALKFILLDAFTSIFTMALMIGAGYMGGNSLRVIKKDITRIEHVGILLIVVIFALYLVFRYLRQRGENIPD